MTDEQKIQFAKAGAAKVNSQSHLYSEKKSQAMQRKIASGYRPQDNAGWGNCIEYPDDVLLEESVIQKLNKVFGIT